MSQPTLEQGTLERCARAIAKQDGLEWSQLDDETKDHFREAARACLGALWQPIETAPKDGTRVLLWADGWTAPDAGNMVGLGWATSNYDARYRIQPTHWMECPEPPALRAVLGEKA